MPTNTYVALDKITVGTAVSTVEFTSINQSYTDLQIVVNGSTSANAAASVKFNNDTGSNYSRTYIYGDGSSAGSGRDSSASGSAAKIFDLSTSNSTAIVNIQNYSNTTTYKTSLSRAAQTDVLTAAYVVLWRSTAAITSVSLTTSTGNFAVGTTFSLYGIAAEGAGYATGGYVTSDSQYWYHTFTGSGTFTPLQSLSCDILMVAGGGSGGNPYGGGGGAGGVFYETRTLSSACTVTVGGGAAAVGSNSRGNSGTNTTFTGSTTAVGGGGGGAESPTRDGITGGSGGGASYTGTGGTATSGQGSAGGLGLVSGGSGVKSGGGGGRGGAGVDATATAAGIGGVGVSTYSSWGAATNTGQNVGGTYFYAGGGGGIYSNISGGAGGNGGGSAGSIVTSGIAASANTGGGGGGTFGGGGSTSGAGGSGIVIVRYAKV